MRRWPALLAGLGAFALYGLTLAPGLTWAHGGVDGGDLLAAALTAGVPHPTGYPTYQIALRATIAAFGGDPARAGAWLSAICAALAGHLGPGHHHGGLRTQRAGLRRAPLADLALD